MNIWIDTRDKTFSVVEPGDINNRQVIEQSIPATLPVQVILTLMGASVSQADMGLDLVYKVTVQE